MANERFQGDFYNLEGTGYTVTLYQAGYGGPIDDFELTALSVVWAALDETDLHTPILGSSCRLGFHIDSTSAQAVFTQLVEAKEEDFKIKIEYESDNSLYWCGFLVPGKVQMQDRPTEAGYVITLDAVDGIARLKSVEYNNGGAPYTGKEQIDDHLFNILGEIDLADYWGVSDTYMYSYVYNWNLTGPDGEDVNSLFYHRLNHKAFYVTDNTGETQYMSCYDVLKEICIAFGARFFFSNGTYWFIEVNNYQDTATTQTFFPYVKAGTWSTEVELNNWGTYRKEVGTSAERQAATKDVTITSGGVRRFLPALDRVEIDYKHYATENLLPGATWNETTGPVQTIEDVDDNSGSARILMRGTVEFKVDFTSDSAIQPGRIKYRIQFKLDDGSTQRYAKRTATYNTNGLVVYGEPEWTSSSSDYYEFYTTDVIFNDSTYYDQFEVMTDFLPQGGDLDVDVQYVEIQGLTGTIPNSGGTAHTLTWDVYNSYLELYFEGTLESRYNVSRFTANNDDTTNKTLLRREVLLGSGPTNTVLGSIEVNNSGTWTWVGLWRRAVDSGSGNLHSSHMAKQILSVRTLPAEILECAIIGDLEAHEVIERDSTRYIFMGGTKNLRTNIFEGSWIAIAYLDTSVTVTDVSRDRYIVYPGERVAPLIDPFRGNFSPIAPSTFPRGAGTMALDRYIYSTSEAFDSADTIDEIDVDTRALSYTLYKGDEIVITNPHTGGSQELELNANYGGSNLDVVDESADYDFPAGSLVSFSQIGLMQLIGEMRRKVVSIQLYDSSQAISGTTTFNVFFTIPTYFNGYQLHGYRVTHHAVGTANGGFDDYGFRASHDDGTTVTNMDEDIDLDSMGGNYDHQVSPLYIEVNTNDIISFSIQSYTNNSGGTNPQGLIVHLEFIATI